jgi:hypothetical protein
MVLYFFVPNLPSGFGGDHAVAAATPFFNWSFSISPQVFDESNEATTRGNHCDVTRPEVLSGSIEDRTHTLTDRQILFSDAPYATDRSALL